MAEPDELDVLLVEDNPGDARLIEEMFREIEPPSGRYRETGVDAIEAADESHVQMFDRRELEPTLSHVDRLETALERIDDRSPSVVLLDLGLPDSQGMATIDAVVERDPTLPVVVLTGLRDREAGIEALNRGAQEFLVKDEINSDLLVRTIYHAIERSAYENELERQREHLAAMNRLNAVVQDINEALIEQSTREEIEQVVCDRLAAFDAYEFAWIGKVERDTGTMTARTEAGVEGYLHDITIRIDDSEFGQGPTGRAVRTGEVQVARNFLNDPDYEPWRNQARKYGFQSSAAIPIKYEGVMYGVLNLYSARPEAFDEEEREIVAQVGTIVGNAINAIERQTALMSEEVVQLEFQIRGVFDDLGPDVSTEGVVTFGRTIPLGDGAFLEYGTATDDGIALLRSLIEHRPHFTDLRIVNEDAGETRFELHLADPPAVSIVATHGGRVVTANLEDGDYNMVVELPHGVDVRPVVEAVQAEYPDLDVIAQRSATSSRRARGTAARSADLTEKQRAALEAAYFSGYFDQPRASTGVEIAESLGITASTFHQHLQAALRKLASVEFDDDRT